MRKKKARGARREGEFPSSHRPPPRAFFFFDYCSFYWDVQGVSAEEKGYDPKHASLKDRGSIN